MIIAAALASFTLCYQAARGGEDRADQHQYASGDAGPINMPWRRAGPPAKEADLQSGHHEPSITEIGGPVARVLSVESIGVLEKRTDAKRAG